MNNPSDHFLVVEITVDIFKIIKIRDFYIINLYDFLHENFMNIFDNFFGKFFSFIYSTKIKVYILLRMP